MVDRTEAVDTGRLVAACPLVGRAGSAGVTFFGTAGGTGLFARERRAAADVDDVADVLERVLVRGWLCGPGTARAAAEAAPLVLVVDTVDAVDTLLVRGAAGDKDA
jgi:hypothetical protein